MSYRILYFVFCKYALRGKQLYGFPSAPLASKAVVYTFYDHIYIGDIYIFCITLHYVTSLYSFCILRAFSYITNPAQCHNLHYARISGSGSTLFSASAEVAEISANGFHSREMRYTYLIQNCGRHTSNSHSKRHCSRSSRTPRHSHHC